jgi:DNA-binding transcriptional LysR family regulator
MMTLDQVRAFVAVAEELHFGRAAERLNMTQPPLSRQIQKLERAVGVMLLERDNRRVSLTEAGGAFLGEAYRLLAVVDGAGDIARRIDSGATGTLRLGFTAASAIGVLGSLLQLFDEHLPGVDVILHERVTAAQADGIRRGELDLGLARPPFDTDAFESRLIACEPLVAAVPASHGLAQGSRPLTPDDFDGVPVIGFNPVQSRYFHELTVRFLTNAHPRVEQEVHQILTAVLLVAAGRGCAFVPASARSLGIEGVAYRELVDGGGDPDGSEITGKPVELHAIWARGRRKAVLRRALTVLGGLRLEEPVRGGAAVMQSGHH